MKLPVRNRSADELVVLFDYLHELAKCFGWPLEPSACKPFGVIKAP